MAVAGYRETGAGGPGLRWAVPLGALLLAASAVGIAWARARMMSRYEAAQAAAEAAEPGPPLLSPEHARVFALGYRDATADYLFATALVDYGLSFETKSRFVAARPILETITRLAPTFPQPYLYADTLLTLQARPVGPEGYRKALELHRRGTAALPLHSELWLVAGQFAAYLAPYELPEEERDAVRRHGARLLARACELASHNENIPHNCIGAAGLLDRAGEREALVRFARRTLVVNDDPEIRDRALAFLKKAVGEREHEHQRRRIEAIEAIWQTRLPFVSRALISLLGPNPDPYACLGGKAGPTCAANWSAWERALSSARQ